MSMTSQSSPSSGWFVTFLAGRALTESERELVTALAAMLDRVHASIPSGDLSACEEGILLRSASPSVRGSPLWNGRLSAISRVSFVRRGAENGSSRGAPEERGEAMPDEKAQAPAPEGKKQPA